LIVLFKRRFHAGIREGRVDRTFRRWKRPQVKVGAEYRLDPGWVLVVHGLDRVAAGDITEGDAHRAGFESVAELLGMLARPNEIEASEEVFRVDFRAKRLALPKPDDRALSDREVEEMTWRLAAMDKRSSRGPWTRRVLELIDSQPRRRAGDLAPLVGREKAVFKADVRKLKRLGLTRSLETGYEISERGRSLLRSGVAVEEWRSGE
jgi:hypothetical protein